MESLLGKHFVARRLALGLTRGQLAGRSGCKNISKGAKKVYDLENCGSDDAEFVGKLAAVLNIDDATINQLVAEDRQRYVEGWNLWADEPITPSLTVRLMPAVYSNQKLPEGTTTLESAEAWASARAKELKLRCCLVWSRRLSIFYAADGTLEGRQVATPDFDPRPFMQVGGKRFLLGSKPPEPTR